MTPHSFLQSIETRAEGAIAQELAVMTHEVLLLRPTLAIEDREYADCLLLKLDQLIRNQQLTPLCGKRHTHCAARRAEHPSSTANCLVAASEETLSAD
jgi:hypothetical protein